MGMSIGTSIGVNCGQFTSNSLNRAFQFTVRTTTAGETMTIPCQNIGTFDATVYWGDGTSSVVTAYNDAGLSHVYAAAGDYDITVTGTFPNVYFYGDAVMAAKVRSVQNLGYVGWTQLERAFQSCANMQAFYCGDCDTSNVTSMAFMFVDAAPATVLDVSRFDTSSVTSMRYMFLNASAPVLDVSGFNTSNVTSMDWMFQGVQASVLDVSGFDTSSVTNMDGVFYNTVATVLDVSGFNTSNVTSMQWTFRDTLATVLDVSSFDTSSVTNMFRTFSGMAATDVAIDGWNITAVTNIDNFMLGSSIPTSRYDATLIAWDAQVVQPNLIPAFGGSKYTLGGAAEAARSNLITSDGWTITDGGGI